MNLVLIFTIAFALGLDAFSVSAAAGGYLKRTNSRQKFRLAFHFGLFQMLMPIVGWLIGYELIKLVKDFDHWIAFAILTGIGIKMIIDAFRENDINVNKDITKGWYLISLSIATSLDALAVGLSFGALGQEILLPSLIIGVAAALLSLAGIKIGEMLSSKFGKYALVGSGISLILIGLSILKEHLSA